jgi:hypothetical protein
MRAKSNQIKPNYEDRQAVLRRLIDSAMLPTLKKLPKAQLSTTGLPVNHCQVFLVLIMTPKHEGALALCPTFAPTDQATRSVKLLTNRFLPREIPSLVHLHLQNRCVPGMVTIKSVESQVMTKD